MAPIDPRHVATLRRVTGPLTNVTPFTFRDGLTYAEKLERTSRSARECIATVNTLIDIVKQLENEVANVTNALRNEFHIEMRQELNALLARIQAHGGAGIKVTDPVDAGVTKLFDEVLANIYDNVRVFADFAVNIDERNLTAADFDAKEWTARRFDLDLDRKTNHATVRERD